MPHGESKDFVSFIPLPLEHISLPRFASQAEPSISCMIGVFFSRNQFLASVHHPSGSLHDQVFKFMHAHLLSESDPFQTWADETLSMEQSRAVAES